MTSRALDGVIRLAGPTAREADELRAGARVRDAEAGVEQSAAMAASLPPESGPGKAEQEVLPETGDFADAVAAATSVLHVDRIQPRPDSRLLSAEAEVGLAVLIRGGADRVAQEPEEAELRALPPCGLRIRARGSLVLHNLRLVHSLVRSYLEQGLDYEDLFQVGVLGLMRAARKFDPAKGCPRCRPDRRGRRRCPRRAARGGRFRRGHRDRPRRRRPADHVRLPRGGGPSAAHGCRRRRGQHGVHPALGSVFGLSLTTGTLATMLGLAVGIDYALFVVSRTARLRRARRRLRRRLKATDDASAADTANGAPAKHADTQAHAEHADTTAAAPHTLAKGTSGAKPAGRCSFSPDTPAAHGGRHEQAHRRCRAR